MTLSFYANRANKSRGLDHMAAITTLRTYINNTGDKKLFEEIRRIRHPDLIRTMVEAGLKPTIMKAALAQHDRLTYRRKT